MKLKNQPDWFEIKVVLIIHSVLFLSFNFGRVRLIYIKLTEFTDSLVRLIKISLTSSKLFEINEML